MKIPPVTVTATSRALALAGLIAMNAALPPEAEARDDCWQCVCFPGWDCGCLGGQVTGYVFCGNIGPDCYPVSPCS